MPLTKGSPLPAAWTTSTVSFFPPSVLTLMVAERCSVAVFSDTETLTVTALSEPLPLTVSNLAQDWSAEAIQSSELSTLNATWPPGASTVNVDGETSKRTVSGSLTLPHASERDKAARKRKSVSRIRRMRIMDYSQPGFWVNFPLYA